MCFLPPPVNSVFCWICSSLIMLDFIIIFVCDECYLYSHLLQKIPPPPFPVLQQQQSELGGHLVSRSGVGRVVLCPPLRSLVCLCLLPVPHSPWFFLTSVLWVGVDTGVFNVRFSLLLWVLESVPPDQEKKKSFMYYQQVNFKVSSQTCDFL